MTFNDLYANIRHLLVQSPVLEKLAPDELKLHARWYWDHGTISWAEDWRGRITGICLIKLFNDPACLDDFYIHVPGGRLLMIEEVFSAGPKTWRKLYEMLYDRWGERDFMIWDRRDKTSRGPRVYTWEKYQVILRRLTHA